MHDRQYLYVGLCVVAILSCGACLPCEYPLCDRETSVADELLIGDWVVSCDPAEPPVHVSINRKQGCSNVLECVESGDRAEPGDDEDVIDLFTTKVQRLRLITWCDEGVGEAPSYSIWLIDPEDEDHLKIYPLDEAVIARAIEARELGGEIRRGWFFGWYTRVLRITSEPAELRSYLAQAGRTCFDRGSPAWTLTRVAQQQ